MSGGRLIRGRLSGWVLTGLAACALAAPAAGPLAAAQAPRGSAAEAAAGEAQDSGVTEPVTGLEDIDEILEGEQEILAGGGYSYDPAGRRDPFKSLLVTFEGPELTGPRPEGIPGLLIDELVLSGIIETPNGFLAQVQAADRQKSYLIRAGDQLYDGDVVSISGNEVIFKQKVNDPTALRPFQEVVKTLNPEG